MARIKIPTANEKLLERYVRHSVYLEQLKKGEASLISRFLGQKVFPSLRDKLIGELSKVKDLETLGSIRKIPAKRLTRMMMAVRKTAQAGAVKAEKMLVNRLVNISRFEARWNKNLIEKTVPFDLDMTLPNNTVLRNLVTMRPFDGHKLGTWMKGYSTAVRVAMVKQIKVGIATGESLPNIAKRINRALNWKGKQAQYIARTAVSSVVHNAREEVFKKNTDIVRKVQWISTLDDRTSMECIHLDGRMYNVGDGPRPPIHFNCRSSVIPITPSWQEFGIVDPPPATRASMNGAVPAKMTYKQWIKKQPKAVQVKVLGKKRAELYRSGRVKIDRFVGRDLKPLNLKQLARREGIDLKPLEVLPAPPRVKAMPIKGVGKLTATDVDAFDGWTWNGFGYSDITRVQRGLKPLAMSPTGTVVSELKVLNIEKSVVAALKKLNGFNGTSYRGMAFDSIRQRTAFLKQFKVGSIYKSKTFLASSKSQIAIQKFTEPKINLTMIIKGRSGRDISKWSVLPEQKEVLFMKGDPLKVDKIVGNKVYLTEITKQAQLKAVPAPPTTVTKVGTTFTKTTSKEIQDVVTKQINFYPEKVKVALNKNGVSYNVGNSLTEIYPELEGKHPGGWSRGATWDSVSGAYSPSRKTISITETYRPVGKKFFVVNSKDKIRASLNHETGHGFDWSGEKLFSSESKFISTYAKDVKNLSRSDIVKNDLRYFLQKGTRGREETFAEVFANLMGQKSIVDIRKFFPEATKYIEDLLK